MLVLSREIGETIHIGDNVTVTVVELRRHGAMRVRLGVDAPPDVRICRGAKQAATDDPQTRAERRLIAALREFFTHGPADSMAALSAIVARLATESNDGRLGDE
jgi:carbon storage regulator